MIKTMQVRRQYQCSAVMRFTRSSEKRGGVVASITGGGSSWSVSGEVYYVYDGNRVIQERDVNKTPAVSYTRGNDLSGTLEGAGGIGGLLARSHGWSSSSGNFSTHSYYHADGNGNVTYLVNSSQGLAASYRYDPYGNLLSSSGPLAPTNTYRFSSKEYVSSVGAYYYLYRFYDPCLQRWLNRDPLSDLGFTVASRQVSQLATVPLLERVEGPNLYCFVANAPENFIDSFGTISYVPFPCPIAFVAYCSVACGQQHMTPAPSCGVAKFSGHWYIKLDCGCWVAPWQSCSPPPSAAGGAPSPS